MSFLTKPLKNSKLTIFGHLTTKLILFTWQSIISDSDWALKKCSPVAGHPDIALVCFCK